MSIKVFENVDYINEINNVNLNQRLIKYSLFMKFIINNSKEVKILNLAKSIYEKSREVPSGALTAIFADPSFGFWLYISKCIENRLINLLNLKKIFTHLYKLKISDLLVEAGGILFADLIKNKLVNEKKYKNQNKMIHIIIGQYNFCTYFNKYRKIKNNRLKVHSILLSR